MSSSSTGYSATVRLRLQVNGEAIKLAQIGPDMVVFDQPVNLPPCEAEIIMDVDDRTRRWAGRLPDGASGESPSARWSGDRTVETDGDCPDGS